jgi:c-di-GMP-binding flagellar brake protein YcgR
MTATQNKHYDIAAENSNYMIRSKMEISYILKAIQAKNEIVTAYFNQGSDFILTVILEISTDSNTIFLGIGVDDALNRRILERDKIIFVSTQDHVRIQFTASKIERSTHQGKPAFKIVLPKELLKLQRREYYRLSTPVINPVKCIIPNLKGGTIEITASDISLGGIAITHYHERLRLSIGDVFPECKIMIPGIEPLRTGLEVRNEQEVWLKNGAKTHRAGCMFIDFPPGQQSTIQRYINKLDRERRAILAQ